MCHCATKIAKYVLFIVNLVISILGIAIIGLGIAILVTLKDFKEIISIDAVPIAVIVGGSFVFVISFLACCGAIKESRCMLICYAILVALLAAMKLWLSVITFRAMGNGQETVDTWIVSGFNNYPQAFHYVEVSFRCCGTRGDSSYTNGSLPIPPSCCNNPDRNNLDWLTNTQWSELPQWIGLCDQSITFRGCASMVGSWFETVAAALGSVLVIIIGVELVAIILASFLCNTIKNKNNEIAVNYRHNSPDVLISR